MSRIEFLGTGAADWPANGERSYSSILVDGRIMVDCAFERGRSARALFITHSHSDHFSLDAARKTGAVLYAEASWAQRVGAQALTPCMPVSVEGYTITPLPANHTGNYPGEQPLHYLFEKEGLCWLYATDGAWMTNAARLILKDKQLDAWIVDATIGPVAPDWRIFEHNSLEMIAVMENSMRAWGMLKKSAPVYLTHMARTLYPETYDLPPLYTAAHDGMTVEIGQI